MAVYFALVTEARRVKIGYSGDVCARMRNLKCDGPYPPILLRAFEGDRAVEAKLHKMFAKFRLHGDWFTFDDSMTGDLGLEHHTPIPLITRDQKAIDGWGTKWSPERRALASATHKALHANPAFIKIKRDRKEKVAAISRPEAAA